jgi:uncharacterized protein (TIGR00251 family)
VISKARGDVARRSAEGTEAAVVFAVRVIPRAKKTTCSGFRDKALVVRVVAPPVEGAANEALIAFFAAALRVPRRAVRIVSGERGRQKQIAIAGVTPEQIRALVPQRPLVPYREAQPIVRRARNARRGAILCGLRVLPRFLLIVDCGSPESSPYNPA